MELKAQTRIPFPRDLVFSSIRDRLPELARYMPNVKSIELLERHDAPPVTRFVNLWTADVDIPAVAQRYIKAEMLKWTDRATWNADGCWCDWDLEVHVWPGVVECRGRNTYNVVGSETELQIQGELQLHLDRSPIPRLFAATARPVVERLVISALRPNLLSVGDAVSQYLKAERTAPPGA